MHTFDRLSILRGQILANPGSRRVHKAFPES